MKDTMMKDFAIAMTIAIAGMSAIEAVADPTLEFGNYYLEKHREAASVLDTYDCQATISYIEAIEDMDVTMLREIVASSVPSDSMAHRLEVILNTLGPSQSSLEAKSAVCAYYLGRAYGAMEGAVMASSADHEALRLNRK